MRISIVIDTQDGSPTISVDQHGAAAGPGDDDSPPTKESRRYPGASDGGSAPQAPADQAQPATFTTPPPQPILGKAGVDAAGSLTNVVETAADSQAAISAGAAPLQGSQEEVTEVDDLTPDVDTGPDGGGSSSSGSTRSKATKSASKRGSQSKR